MGRMHRVAAVAGVVLILAGCKDKDEAEKVPTPPPAAPQEFTPPANGLVDLQALGRWRQADSLVRLVDSVYLDSVRLDPSRQADLQASQDKARDIAVRKAGLLGWKEYDWVLQVAATNPANAAAFQAAGLSAAAPVSSR